MKTPIIIVASSDPKAQVERINQFNSEFEDTPIVFTTTKYDLCPTIPWTCTSQNPILDQFWSEPFATALEHLMLAYGTKSYVIYQSDVYVRQGTYKLIDSLMQLSSKQIVGFKNAELASKNSSLITSMLAVDMYEELFPIKNPKDKPAIVDLEERNMDKTIVFTKDDLFIPTYTDQANILAFKTKYPDEETVQKASVNQLNPDLLHKQLVFAMSAMPFFVQKGIQISTTANEFILRTKNGTSINIPHANLLFHGIERVADMLKNQ